MEETKFSEKWLRLLTKTIIACESTRRTLTIYQTEDARRRATILLEKASPLFDREYLDDGDWHEMFILLLAAHGHHRELTFNEIEELSDRAMRLNGLCSQL